MKKILTIILMAAMCLSFAACGGENNGNVETGGLDYTVVRTTETPMEDGSVIVHGYNKDDIHVNDIVKSPDGSVIEHKMDQDGNRISETYTAPDGSVYEHKYDKDGNHISESSTLADGSYHEFKYDKDGNIIEEIHE